MQYVLDCNSMEGDRLGGKGRALAAMRDQAVTVPPWFAVTPEAAQWLSGDPDQVGVKLRDDARAELSSALDMLCPAGETVAVRSSASDEDGKCHSFAGQFDSYLCVSPEHVAEKVVAVWQSAFGKSVLAYRARHGLDDTSLPSVVVQRMVGADAAGVAFAMDPVSGDPHIAVVSAVFGLGTGLVSGACDADTYHIDAEGAIVKRSVARKDREHRPAGGTCHGVCSIPVDESRATLPVLSDEQVREVAALVRLTSRHFGAPQDIEWAFSDGRLYLLQSRPVTATGAGAQHSGVLTIWDNSNIVESYNGVTTPLTFSFASYVYNEVYRQLCRILGVSQSRIDANSPVFLNMLGLIQGRVYYNLLNWYRGLALLPGFQSNRGFMEQMMGVKAALPADALDSVVNADWHARLWDRICLVHSAFALIAQHLRLRKTIARFYQRLNNALALEHAEISELEAQELIALYGDAERKLLRRWDAPLLNDFLAMIFFGLLGRLCQKWLGKRELSNELLRDTGGTVSIEPARHLGDMAEIAKGNARFTALLCQGSLSEIREAMEEIPAFFGAFQAYIHKFGNRCLEELKLESPTLRDDPLPLLRTVGNLARREAPVPRDNRAVRVEAEAYVRRLLGTFDPRRYIFAYVLHHARGRIRDRENLRFERTRLFGYVRNIFLGIGQCFQEAGILNSAQDIFYLEKNEIFGFVEGRATTRSLRQLVALRRAEFEDYRAAPPPPGRFETRGMFGVLTSLFNEASTAAGPDSEVRQGLGCCAGIVSGPVRLIADPRTDTLLDGEILAAKSTDPGWILHFASAAGILVERGSLLSHSAIVSRELGIPCVVSIPGLTSWIRTGDHVQLDGATGQVRRISGAVQG